MLSRVSDGSAPPAPGMKIRFIHYFTVLQLAVWSGSRRTFLWKVALDAAAKSLPRDFQHGASLPPRTRLPGKRMGRPRGRAASFAHPNPSKPIVSTEISPFMRKKAPVSRERGLFAGLALRTEAFAGLAEVSDQGPRRQLLSRRNFTHQHATRVVHEFGRCVQLVPHRDHLCDR